MTTRPTTVRPAAVSGAFYPADPAVLAETIRRSFGGAVRPAPDAAVPRALVVPHAGYVYSGPIAASAYARVAPSRGSIRRVVLLGPSHRMFLRGLALSSADAWATPLGLVPVDHSAADDLAHLPFVVVDDRPHAAEHSLEVQVPFLQTVLDEITLVPVVVGDATTEEVAAALEVLWGGPETLVVVSTDLSHYHRHDEAVALDARTAAAVVARRPEVIGDRDACGARPLRGLLRVADERHLTVEEVDRRTSGDTAGDKERVVGYGSFALT